MTDEPALLAAVVAAPDDDTPRLVTADWLDDHGRPERAEFIRVQCRLAAASPGDDDYPDLLDRQAELAVWLKTFEPQPPPRQDVPLRTLAFDYQTYSRGFPDTVTWHAQSESRSEFRRLLNAVGKHVATSPARSLQLLGLSPEYAAEFIRHPVVAALRGLTLHVADDEFELALDVDDDKPRMTAHGPAGNLVAEAFAASPHVKHLRRLNLMADLTDASAAILARADLSGLTDLRLGVSVASPRAVAPLGGAAWFRNLRVLRMSEHLGDAHLEAVAALPPLPHLHTLDLADNRFEWIALRALAASKSFPNLAALDLSRNPLGEEGAGYLGKAAFSVRSLNLRGCMIGDRGLKALLAGKLLDGVRVLELSNNDVSAAGIKLLAKSPKLGELRHLNLEHNRIGKDGFAALAASPNLARLTDLDVGVFPGESRLKGDVIFDFLQTLDAPQLRRLGVVGLAVGAKGAKVLATRPTFANLRRLDMQECGLRTAGFDALATSPQLRELVSLDVWDNGIAAAPTLLDPTTFPRMAKCRLQINPLPPPHAQELAARRGVQVTPG